jgi:putative transposase
MIEQTSAWQGIARGTLTIQADRSAAILAEPIAFVLPNLGVTETHGRPHVSNHNQSTSWSRQNTATE